MSSLIFEIQETIEDSSYQLAKCLEMRGRHPQDGTVVLDYKVCAAVRVPEGGVGVVVEEDVGLPDLLGAHVDLIEAIEIAWFPLQMVVNPTVK